MSNKQRGKEKNRKEKRRPSPVPRPRPLLCCTPPAKEEVSAPARLTTQGSPGENPQLVPGVREGVNGAVQQRSGVQHRGL